MSSIFNRIRQWPYYIFLFSVFFVLHGFAKYFRFVSATSALLLSLFYIAVSLVIAAFFYLFYKKFSKAALITFFIMAFHFFFGNILDLLTGIFKQGFVLRYSFIVPAFLVAATILFFIIKKRSTVFTITYYLNILMVILIIIDTGTLLFRVSSKKKGLALQGTDTGDVFSLCDTCPKPDVYIILLDEYAGARELKDIFHYDNQPFYDSLGLRGFKTIANSHSNYNYTPYSTATTLNMKYLDPQKTSDAKKGYKYAIDDINDNRTVNFFLANGYRFFNYSPFTVAYQSAPAEGSFVPVNTKLITAGTFLTRFEKDVWLSVADKMNITWYLKKSMYVTLKDNDLIYNLTKNIAETKTGPKVIYTHLLMPHYPYYYNEAGELRSFDTLRKSLFENTEHYLSYLKYTNKQMTVLIDHILSHSSMPPVIALISDHGYRHYKNNRDPKYYYSNLLSIHLPGGNYSLYSDSTSNINFFRILLNSEFNQKLPLLEDKTFLIDF